MAPQQAIVEECQRSLAPASQATPRSGDWLKKLAPYRQAQTGRALAELAITALPFVGLWLAMWLTLPHGYWLTLVLAVPAAGLLVRLFAIQHDCGHGSFFPGRRTNDWLGRVIGVLTLTPYAHWRHEHALHHASSGNLDRRGRGDVEMLTLVEFQALPRWRRTLYRLSRSPLAVLGLGPLFVFVLKHRLPDHPGTASARAWMAVMATNVAIVLTIVGLSVLVGARDLLLVQLPITWLASAMGIWLFYVQHHFEHTYWERDSAWSQQTGALHGSSHFDLPPILRWLTANIGAHHLHHICSRIPSYRLGEALAAYPELRGVNRLTLRGSLQSFHLALWDESEGRLVRFPELGARKSPSPVCVCG
jgi:omega-6 fatty acid desaturase (delta-12 desaturase)